MATFSLLAVPAATFRRKGGAGHLNRPVFAQYNRRTEPLRSIATTLERIPMFHPAQSAMRFMRPGVVWLGEQRSRNELERVEIFLMAELATS